MAGRGHIFRTVSMKKNRTNTFDLSHDKKVTMQFGKLVPTLVQEVIPGDTFYGSQKQLVRFAPMLAPVMHNVKVYTHFFFVPNRLVWDNWSDFITGGEDGFQEPAWPYIAYGNAQGQESSIFDYMGLPTYSDAGTIQVSAIPFASYNLIYNEYYRDQNLEKDADILSYKLVDGANNTLRDEMALQDRPYEHDYFTSSLPFTQKGPEVGIPIGDTAPLETFDTTPLSPTSPVWKDQIGNNGYTGAQSLDIQPGGTNATLKGSSQGGAALIDVSQYTRVKLSDVAGATIINLRNAFRLQEWLEKNARGGSRYTESIYIHFGIKSPDARLQRPEYIGGGVSTVTFSEVLNTTGSIPPSSETPTFTPQGNMTGHGIQAGKNGTFKYFAKEHGYIIGITSVMPKTQYQQGVPRHFRRRDKYDYYWKQFAHIGEQPIENSELFVANDGLNANTFGYTPRYSEYRYNPSTIHGAFRSSLSFWHLGRIFSDRPVLNKTFIKPQNSDLNRIFAVYDSENPDNMPDPIWAHIYIDLKAKRQIPVYGNPTL